MATHDTKKMDVMRNIAESDRNDNSEYSTKSLRKNMSTGGGQPIPKGEKWTTERRSLQPRHPDTGHFTFNADAGFSRKWKPGAKRKFKTIPLSIRRTNFDFSSMAETSVVNMVGRTFVSNEDMDADEFISYFHTLVGGDYTADIHGKKEVGSVRSGDYGSGYKEGAEFNRYLGSIDGEMLFSGVNDTFTKKRGRKSRFEKDCIEKAVWNVSRESAAARA